MQQTKGGGWSGHTELVKEGRLAVILGSYGRVWGATGMLALQFYRHWLSPDKICPDGQEYVLLDEAV